MGFPYDPVWLAARLNAPCPAADATLPPPVVFDESALKPAAVLVALVGGAEPGVLLTKRTGHLRRHSGQVSFPGGRIDPGDASPEAAALREAQEEIGLDPALPAIVGRLPDHVVLSGYRMTPVVALLRPGFTTLKSDAEVESVFLLPLATLLDPQAPQRHAAELRGQQTHYWVWPHAEHHIWGATAAILVGLAARLRAG